jgi:competence protein ComEC
MCSAFGAALSYYLLFPLYRGGVMGVAFLLFLLFVPVAAACFLRALGSLSFAAGFGQEARRRLSVLTMLVLAFAASLAIGVGAGARVTPGPFFGIEAETVTGISGTLLDDPRIVSNGSAMARISLQTVSGRAGERASASGELTVFFREENAGRLREFGRGTVVFAEGRLQESTGSFASSYLFNAGSLHVTAKAGSLDRLRTGIRLALSDRFAPVSQTAVSPMSVSQEEAWGGLALALLLGVRDNLDSGFTALYRNAGISYILALSGMHLAVIIALVSFLLKKPFGVRPAAIAGAVIIAAYCFLVGPLPSLYRSALMYILAVFTVLGMLKRDSLSILSMAFVIQLVLTPQDGFSLSFMLSYLAMVGILVLGRSLNGILSGTIPRFLLGSFSLSLGAFIGTAAIVSWFFGEIRPVGIIASLVVAPLTTVFMVVSMAWLAIGALLPALSPLLAWVLSALYNLMEATARLAGFMPGIKANPYLVLLFSLAVAVLLPVADSRLRSKRKVLMPFA